jgi:hypothetical protein
MAAPVIGSKGTIYCLEPMPDVCTALKLNIIKYKEWADQRQLKVARVEAICAGACRTPRLVASEPVCITATAATLA